MDFQMPMLDQMYQATELTRQGRLVEATALIQRTLQARPTAAPASPAAQTTDRTAPSRGFKRPRAEDVIDVEPVTVNPTAQRAAPTPEPAKPEPQATASHANPHAAFDTHALLDRLGVKIPRGLTPTQSTPTKDAPPRAGGELIEGSFTLRDETRPYRVFVPPTAATTPRPMVVMLHGCVQKPEDFAEGTRMNELAKQQGFVVLWPEQTLAANKTVCWNWYRTEDQRRGEGEAALLAAMTRDVMQRYNVDPKRVYVAGLSAGASMAALLGATHPELFAGVGVHSGLAPGAAHDLPTAMAAMKGKAYAAKGDVAQARTPVPTIVFHGDKDVIVHPDNAKRVVEDVIKRGMKVTAAPAENGRVPNGHGYTRTLYRDAGGKVLLEQWVIHGAGHAWSGGDEAGKFMDPKGPDASAAMLRFFFGER